jgi:uncharacterized protein
MATAPARLPSAHQARPPDVSESPSSVDGSPAPMLIKRHRVLSYYIATFTISWGGFLLVGGSGRLSGTSWQSDPRVQLAVLVMVAGPTIAGILWTGLVGGSLGLRELVARLRRWRVGAGWYAIALLTVPALLAAILLALSLTSPVYLPAIVTVEDKASLLGPGIAIGLMGGLVEELGWTGFAIPTLRLRHSVLTTGVIVGVLWGAWHLLQMFWVGGTSSGAVAQSVFMLQYVVSAIAGLTAYRVLMVWVYDGTASVLLPTLMHASYIASTLFILAPPIIGVPFLTFSLVWAAALWLVVAAVLLGEQRAAPRDYNGACALNRRIAHGPSPVVV